MKYMQGSDQGLDDNKVDWNDYNYPPCIKIFHYIGDQVPDKFSRKVLLWKINHIFIILANLINFVTNIVNFAQGLPHSGIRIAISFFLFLIWIPISFYIFIIPYETVMKRNTKVFIFYILSVVTFVWYLIWSIANFADANGFIQVSQNFSSGRSAAGFFGLVTSLIMISIAILTVINTITFARR